MRKLDAKLWRRGPLKSETQTLWSGHATPPAQVKSMMQQRAVLDLWDARHQSRVWTVCPSFRWDLAQTHRLSFHKDVLGLYMDNWSGTPGPYSWRSLLPPIALYFGAAGPGPAGGRVSADKKSGLGAPVAVQCHAQTISSTMAAAASDPLCVQDTERVLKPG